MLNNNTSKRHPLYGQIPLDLLRDPDISMQAKAMYGLLHTYCDVGDKLLWLNPKAYPPEKKLAEDMGVCTATVRTYLKELHKEGWVDIERRGKPRPNKYTLFGFQVKARKKIHRDKDFWELMKKMKAQANDVKDT